MFVISQLGAAWPFLRTLVLLQQIKVSDGLLRTRLQKSLHIEFKTQRRSSDSEKEDPKEKATIKMEAKSAVRQLWSSCMKGPSADIAPCFKEHVDHRIVSLRSAPCMASESLFKDGGFGFGGQRACPQDPRSPPSKERSDSRSGPWCKADLCSFLAAQVLRIMEEL